MSPFSFIQFNQPDDGMVLPVVRLSDIAFQYTYTTDFVIRLVQEDTGAVIAQKQFETPYMYNNVVPIDLGVVFPSVSVDGCFRIELVTSTDTYHSNLLSAKASYAADTMVVEYRCDEAAFGFEYACNAGLYNRIRLPISLKFPQFLQNQEVYLTRSGRLRVMSAVVSKEYILQTDYFNEDWHRKLVAALSHDYLTIDGELLTKTDKYEIEWLEGIAEAQATCKLGANINARNSSCGTCSQPSPVPPPGKVSIQVVINPDGSGSSTGAGIYDKLAPITLTAIPAYAKRFEGWYLDGLKVSSSKVYNVTAAQNTTYEARFVDAIHITTVVDPTNAGTTTGGGYYEPGDMPTLVAIEATNYDFEGWYLNGIKVSNSSNYNITVGLQNISYEARFRPVAWRVSFASLICRKAALPSNMVIVISSDTSKGAVSGGGSVYEGDDITVTASPGAGCYFIGWFDESSLQVSTDEVYTFTPIRDITLTARFAENGASYTASFTDFICQKVIYQ